MVIYSISKAIHWPVTSSHLCQRASQSPLPRNLCLISHSNQYAGFRCFQRLAGSNNVFDSSHCPEGACCALLTCRHQLWMCRWTPQQTPHSHPWAPRSITRASKKQFCRDWSPLPDDCSVSVRNHGIQFRHVAKTCRRTQARTSPFPKLCFASVCLGQRGISRRLKQAKLI